MFSVVVLDADIQTRFLSVPMSGMGKSFFHKSWEQSQCRFKNRNWSLERTGETERRKNPLRQLVTNPRGVAPTIRASAWLRAVVVVLLVLVPRVPRQRFYKGPFS